MEETGTVEKILPDGEVMITVERSSACGNCSMSGFCFSNDTKSIKLKAKPDFPVKIGQAVRLSIDEGNFLRYSIITYFMPVVLLITGVVIGDSIKAGSSGSPLFSIIGGAAGLLLGLLLVRRYSKKVEAKKKTIIKVTDVR